MLNFCRIAFGTIRLLETGKLGTGRTPKARGKPGLRAVREVNACLAAFGSMQGRTVGLGELG